jgi:hypothetical protein
MMADVVEHSQDRCRESMRRRPDTESMMEGQRVPKGERRFLVTNATEMNREQNAQLSPLRYMVSANVDWSNCITGMHVLLDQ